VSPARWITGLAASALLHGAGLAALALTTRPDPVPEQDMPRARFAVEAAEVARSRANPGTPQGTPAQEADAATAPARQGAVPQSRAQSTAPAADVLAPAASGTPTLAASAAPGTTLPAAAPKSAPLAPLAAPAALPADNVRSAPLATVAPVFSSAFPIQPEARPAAAEVPAAAPLATARLPAATLTATPGDALALTAAAPLSQDVAAGIADVAALASNTPQAETLPATSAQTPALASARPRAETLASATPEAEQTAPRPADSTNAPPADTAGTPTAVMPAPAETATLAAPDSTAATPRPLPAQRGRAELAFSGAGDMAVGPASLAAIAAFSRASDLDAAASQLRDGIEGLLAAVPCARLQTEFDPATGTLALRGHIPEETLRAPLLAALQEQLGGAIAVTDSLLVLPRPQCGALAGIAAAGLPQSTDQLDNPAVIGADGFARTYSFAANERLDFDLTAPDYDAYLYFDYFTADGSVLHLVPNHTVPLVPSPAQSTLSVGRADGDRPFLELTVAPPFGQEIAAVFAASTPLYEGLRPMQEPAAPYLAFLKDRIARARAEDPGFKGEWVYYFITTRAE
jgi:hypothetical protein